MAGTLMLTPGTLRSHATPTTGHSASENESRYRSGRASIPRVYLLADARAVTLSPPILTKLSCIASRMATERDVEYNQMILNACVLLDGL